ncbi:MAG: hypothetical protein ACXU8O_03965 [Asticcacaulis sp.]
MSDKPTAAQRLFRRIAAAVTLTTVTSTAVAFFMNFWHFQDQICQVPLLQPGVADTCGAFSLGGRPTHEQRVAFEALPPGDCQALSQYRARYESSPLRSIVDSRLNDRHLSSQVSWSQRTVTLPLTHIAGDAASRTEDAARTQAIKDAAPEAQRLCDTLAVSGNFKISEVSVQAATWQCARTGGGYSCGFDGTSQCVTQQKIPVYVCGSK